jgi:hypothetical protein
MYLWTELIVCIAVLQAAACSALLDFVAVGLHQGAQPIAAPPLDILLPFSQVRLTSQMAPTWLLL